MRKKTALPIAPDQEFIANQLSDLQQRLVDKRQERRDIIDSLVEAQKEIDVLERLIALYKSQL